MQGRFPRLTQIGVGAFRGCDDKEVCAVGSTTQGNSELAKESILTFGAGSLPMLVSIEVRAVRVGQFSNGGRADVSRRREGRVFSWDCIH